MRAAAQRDRSRKRPTSSKASAEGKGTDIAKDVASTRDNAVFFFEKRMENS